MNEQFNIDKVIKEANAKKKLLEKKEHPLDIENHPIDQLDILIAECNQENYTQTIKELEKIFKADLEEDEIKKLREELIAQIEDQINLAKSEKEKCDDVEDVETKSLTKAKWDDKIRLLNKLNNAIKEEIENQDENE